MEQIKEGIPKAEIGAVRGLCGVCGTTDDLKQCTRCHLTSYCGKEHQAKDWPSHKKVQVQFLVS